MKYCEKCPAKNGNFDFFVMTSQTSCGAERVNYDETALSDGPGNKKVAAHKGCKYRK